MRLRTRALAAVLCVLLGAACGRKPPADGKVHLRFLVAPDAHEYSRRIVARFEKTHPGIVVEMVEGPTSSNAREDLYSASFMSKEDTYDLAYVDVSWVPKFAAQGWLRPLDDRFTPALRREFLPGDIAGSTYHGRLYRLPMQSDGGVLYYRKDLLASKGFPPPETWTQLVKEAKALRTPDRAGFVFEGRQYEGLVCVYLEFLWGFGGDFLGPDGKVALESPQAVAALTALTDAVRKDKISPESVLTYEEEEARHAFQSGKAVFMRSWPYAWGLMQQKDSPVRGKIGMIPMVHGPGGTSAATLGGWGFGLSAFSKHPAEAWEFARFYTDAESEKTAFRLAGILPARRALYSDPALLKTNPELRLFYPILMRARPRLPHPRWARISDSLQLHVSAALAGLETPAQAMARAAREIRPVVEP
jgi:multiple sugar transport system substrate-binding protein